MDILMAIIGLLLCGYLIYFIITSLLTKSEINKKHAMVMGKLKPYRKITLAEVDKFKKVYKRTIKENHDVYRTTGSFNYFAYGRRGHYIYEYSINGIRINAYSAFRLEKEDIGISLNKFYPRHNEFYSKVEKLNKDLRDGIITQSKHTKTFNNLLYKYSEPQVDFVFLKPNIRKTWAFLVAIDDWNLDLKGA